MMEIAVRQSGGANIVSIPKAIIQALGLTVGSRLVLTLQDNSIVLTPVLEEPTLEELLENSPKECFALTAEDRAWIDAPPVGKEI